MATVCSKGKSKVLSIMIPENVWLVSAFVNCFVFFFLAHPVENFPSETKEHKKSSDRKHLN